MLSEKLQNAMINFYTNLFDRWQDEKEYEDFKEYQKTAKDVIKLNGLKFHSLEKEPFELIFKDDDNVYYLKKVKNKISLSFKKLVVMDFNALFDECDEMLKNGGLK